MEENNLTDERLIEDYLAGDLSDEQTQEVEQRLKHDTGFKQQLELEKEIVNGIREASRQELLVKLQKLERSLPPVKHQTKVVHMRKPNVYWMVAASIGLIIALFVLWPSRQPDPYALYATYYEPYPNFSPVAVRGEGDSNLSITEEGMLAYDQRNYTVAIEKLTTALDQTQAQEIGFYLAQSYLAMGNTKEAIRLFERLSVQKSDLQEMINWYLSLALLKEGEVEKARVGLQNITREKSYNFEKAEELLQELD